MQAKGLHRCVSKDGRGTRIAYGVLRDGARSRSARFLRTRTYLDMMRTLETLYWKRQADV